MSENIEQVNISPEVAVEAPADKVVSEQPVADQGQSLMNDQPAVADSVQAEVKQESWIDSLSDEVKSSSFVEKFKDKSIEDVIKSAINAEKLIGKKVDDFSKEELEAFMNKSGRPESADAYQLAEDLGEGAGLYKEAFHKAGVTQEQAKMLTDTLIEHNRAQAEQFEAEMQTKLQYAQEELQKEFGSAYPKRIQLAKSTIEEFGGKELLAAINNSGLGADPNVIRAFAKIGKEFGEGKIIAADSAAKFGTSVDEAKAQIARLQGDPNFMAKYMATGEYSKTSAAHKQAVKEMRELFRLAYPN